MALALDHQEVFWNLLFVVPIVGGLALGAAATLFTMSRWIKQRKAATLQDKRLDENIAIRAKYDHLILCINRDEDNVWNTGNAPQSR